MTIPLLLHLTGRKVTGCGCRNRPAVELKDRCPDQVGRQTGSLSYRLSSGEQAHARRLVAGQADESRMGTYLP